MVDQDLDCRRKNYLGSNSFNIDRIEFAGTRPRADLTSDENCKQKRCDESPVDVPCSRHLASEAADRLD